MNLQFVEADAGLDRAREILRRERDRLTQHGVGGELLLTGGSSTAGALTGGDVDLHLRVDPSEFDGTVSTLRDVYAVVHPEIWTPTLATFELPGERVGIAVTPVGSVHDRRFVAAWRRLRADPAALHAYNELKRAHAGADPRAYEEAKGAFFTELTSDEGDRRDG